MDENKQEFNLLRMARKYYHRAMNTYDKPTVPEWEDIIRISKCALCLQALSEVSEKLFPNNPRLRADIGYYFDNVNILLRAAKSKRKIKG